MRKTKLITWKHWRRFGLHRLSIIWVCAYVCIVIDLRVCECELSAAISFLSLAIWTTITFFCCLFVCWIENYCAISKNKWLIFLFFSLRIVFIPDFFFDIHPHKRIHQGTHFRFVLLELFFPIRRNCAKIHSNQSQWFH